MVPLLGCISVRIFSDLRPGQFRQRPRARAGLERVLARRGAVHRALRDALQDARRCGTGCRRCRNPRSTGRCACARCACSSAATYSRSVGMPSAARSRPRDAAELARRRCASSCSGRRNRRADGPSVESSQSSTARMRGSVGMEDQVVEAVVAVHDRGLVARRDVLRQPRDQLVHRLDLLGLGGLVLLAPARRSGARSSCPACRNRRGRSPRSRRCAARDDAVHLVVDRARARPCVMPGSAWSQSTRPSTQSMT